MQVDTVTTFYCSAGAGIVGALLTWVFLPDTTGLDLAEIDRYHRFMLAGQVGEGVLPRQVGSLSALNWGRVRLAQGSPEVHGLGTGGGRPGLHAVAALERSPSPRFSHWTLSLAPLLLIPATDSQLSRSSSETETPVAVGALAGLRCALCCSGTCGRRGRVAAAALERAPHAVASGAATQCGCARIPAFCAATLRPLLIAAPRPRHLNSAGKHYDPRLDAQQRKLQDMAADQEAEH